MNLNVILFVLFSFLVYPTFSNSFAQSIMSNEQYEIHMSNLNSFSGKISKSKLSPQNTKGNLAPGIYSGPNYILTRGLPSNDSKKPFTFSINTTLIDFGPLSPGAPVTRTNIVDVTPGSATGYNIYAYQDHPLKNDESGSIIPDTTCDYGACDELKSSEWENILTFGFGYRCSNLEGLSCMSDFKNESYFKQFADQESDEAAQAIMRSMGENGTDEAEITYKINTSSSQPYGVYKNNIYYIAVPAL